MRHNYVIERLGDDPAAGEYAVAYAEAMHVSDSGALLFLIDGEVVSVFNEWVEAHRADAWPISDDGEPEAPAAEEPLRVGDRVRLTAPSWLGKPVGSTGVVLAHDVDGDDGWVYSVLTDDDSEVLCRAAGLVREPS